MRASRYVAKNAFLMTVGLFAGRILAFLIFRRMTGTVGVEGMGVWGLSVDLTSIILTVSTFGLTTLITREIIKDHADTWPIFWAAFRIRLLLGFATYALLAAYVFATGYDGATRAAVMLMAVGVLLESTGLACDSVLQAHEKVEHSTWSQLVSAAVYFALAWWWLDAGFGVMGVVWANVVSRAARLVIVLPLMVRVAGSWRGAASARRVGLRWMLRLGLPLFMATTFGIISYKIDTVIIMEMLGKLAAGVYTIGHRPLDLLLIVPYLFAAALFPSLMRYREQERDGETGHVERMGERALRYQHLVVFPLTLFCTLAAAPLIRLATSGDADLSASVTVFRVAIWGVPVQAASIVFNRLLMTAGQERTFMRIALASMTTNIGLNLLVVPVLGSPGAAGVTVLSLGVGLVMHRVYLRRAGIVMPVRRALVDGSAAMLLAWAAAVLLGKLAAPGWGVSWFALPTIGIWPFAAMTALAGVLYVVALVGLRVVGRDDLRLVAGLWPGRR
ncbi:MAG: flippase [bacterium]|nr:flippase [bacterium]